MSGGIDLTKIPANYKRVAAGVLALAILAYYSDWLLDWRVKFGFKPDQLQSGPVENGIMLVIIVWLVYIVATGQVSIWMVVNGFDGRASTSKFQPFLWTVVVVWAYVVILSALWQVHPQAPMPEIPGNVLIALGIAFGTAAAAKVVTNNKVNEGAVEKPTTSGAGAAPLFQDDGGRPDLYKIQTLAFTFIALAAFVAAVLRMIPEMARLTQEQLTTAVSLPDISDGLMALMGIGSAAYLTKKLTDTKSTYLTSLSLDTVSLTAPDPQRKVTVTGANLGTSQGTSSVSIDGIKLQVPIADWTDTTFSFVVPKTAPDGSTWKPNEPLEVKVTGSSNALRLVVTP